jgi:CheY-like chemotaxis protein
MGNEKKAVIVDDDPKVIMLIEKVLIPLGFQVFSAAEGKKALELVKEEKPNLLISDILQPGIDGISLCRLVKSDPESWDIKVILMTGVYKQASFKTQMDCAPDAFIEKPLEVAALTDLVKGESNPRNSG